MVDIATSAIDSTAIFSDCKKYRYILKRNFGKGKGTANFIMLNPSTADETFNDPTVHRCETRTIAMGYKTMIVTNIFAYRATDPKDMKAQKDPIGVENLNYILESASNSDLVICAWGSHGKHLDRGQITKNTLIDNKIKTHYLKLNNNGEPSHPLYLPHKLKPMEWKNV